MTRHHSDKPHHSISPRPRSGRHDVYRLDRLRPAGEPWWHIWAGIAAIIALVVIGATGLVAFEPTPTFQEAQP